MTVRRIDVQNEAEWLEARRSGIGASEAAMLLGVSPWGTPLDLYARKLGLLPDVEETEKMRLGRRLEPIVAAEYAERFPDHEVGDPEQSLFRSRTEPILLATPDRWVMDPVRGPGLLEIKTTSVFQRDRWDPDGTPDGCPEHVQIQVQAQLAVVGGAWAAVAVLLGGQEIRCYPITRNQAFIDLYTRHAVRFWAEHVLAKTPPPATGASLETLKALYRDIAPRTVELPAEAVDWDRELEEGARVVKEGQAQVDGAKAKLLAALEDAEMGVLPGGAVAYLRSVVIRKGYEVKPAEFVSLRRKSLGGGR
jgi:putative phage-type endonuclease